MRDPRDNLARAGQLYRMAGLVSGAAEATQLLRAAEECVRLAEEGAPDGAVKAEIAALRSQITAHWHYKPWPTPPAADT